jgi:RsiW-degrading membrane proteinase PrsW (M82 family)
VLKAALALLPVLFFLGVLVLMDSFKLVPLRTVLRAIVVGCLAALFCTLVTGPLLDATGMPLRVFSRYGAPPLEELAKGVWVAWLIRRQKVGFLVDAAILGFAVGAGFAVVENVEYLRHLATPNVLVWVVRGFGTAILHGAATALFAILGKSLVDRRAESEILDLVPGFVVAVAIHSAYNHFLLPPLVSTAILLVVLPPLVILAFGRSEQATREWLGLGMDTDVELLQSIRTGKIADTRVGAYLRSLTARFPGPVVADILCLLRIHLELSIRAKGLLMAREAGLPVVVGPEVVANLEELRYLEKAIGPTGLLAMKPIRRQSSRDLWQLQVLADAGGRKVRTSRGREKT